jgi:hypothetical protein
VRSGKVTSCGQLFENVNRELLYGIDIVKVQDLYLRADLEAEAESFVLVCVVAPEKGVIPLLAQAERTPLLVDQADETVINTSVREHYSGEFKRVVHVGELGDFHPMFNNSLQCKLGGQILIGAHGLLSGSTGIVVDVPPVESASASEMPDWQLEG